MTIQHNVCSFVSSRNSGVTSWFMVTPFGSGNMIGGPRMLLVDLRHVSHRRADLPITLAVGLRNHGRPHPSMERP
ncbi:hypothetical protein PISMIDRAFT_500887 [Pisolithus microcarpus 441]|uniref:Uncharacterized protein n=1 Tax=Pisolithus microcarpus 441 TaxID=765257 RepID=A0A0C9Z8V6_9AGAM|nr:hypothetical protein PISMIDRAFT_500887 [Pisolithus microcarpus 441]